MAYVNQSGHCHIPTSGMSAGQLPNSAIVVGAQGTPTIQYGIFCCDALRKQDIYIFFFLRLMGKERNHGLWEFTMHYYAGHSLSSTALVAPGIFHIQG